MGVKIVGVGFDSVQENQEWAEDQSYLFDIWTDDNKTLAMTYGAASSASTNMPSRVTMLLDAEGELVLEYTVSLQIGTHPEQVLSDAQKLFGSGE